MGWPKGQEGSIVEAKTKKRQKDSSGKDRQNWEKRNKNVDVEIPSAVPAVRSKIEAKTKKGRKIAYENTGENERKKRQG